MFEILYQQYVYCLIKWVLLLTILYVKRKKETFYGCKRIPEDKTADRNCFCFK
jgi:hypothetical protein